MDKPSDTGTDSTTPQAIPRPVIPLARDGGLGYDDIERNPSDTLQIQVGPSSDFRVNDTLAIVWGADETQVAQHTLTADDVRTIVNLYAPVETIHRIGEGSHPVIARLYSALSPGDYLDSPPETVRVKFSRPGGTDPMPDTPHLNENLSTPVIAPDPIPDDLQGVSVTVRPYENMAAGDTITVSWGGKYVTYGPLNPGETGRDVVVAMPPETLRAAGGGVVPITYEIYDTVHNWSLWAPYAYREVPIEDPDAPPAPWVEGTTGDKQTELDLAVLGAADVIVLPEDYGGKAGDGVTVHWRGATAANQPTEYDTDEKILARPGQSLSFTVPNAEAAKLAQGHAQVTYTLRRAAGGSVESRRRRLSVVGDLIALAPPRVQEAVRDLLDPSDTANGATVQIAPWPGIAAGDLCTLEWVGTRANGEATHYSDEQYATGGTIDRGLEFIVEADEVDRLLNGSVRIFYTVDTFGTARSPRGVIRQILARLESPVLTLQVREAAGNQPLPAPLVREAVDGVLDPDAHRTAHLDIPTSSEIQKGDRIDAVVTGGAVPFSDWVPVANPAQPPSFLLPAAFVSGNRDRSLIASYTLSRDGYSGKSASYGFDIGVVRVTLPAPVVADVKDGVLDPNLVSTTVLIPDSAAAIPGADVTLTWKGRTTYAPTLKVPGQGRLEFPIAATYISGNRNADVEVSYTIGASTSEVLRFHVADIDPFAIDPSTVTLAVGAAAQRQATGGTPPYAYQSSQTAVASVSANGLVTAMAPGDAVITASDAASHSGAYPVRVPNPLYIDPSVMTLSVGGIDHREATGGTLPYSYSSSDQSTVSVAASDGTVTAKKPGSATITATDASHQTGKYRIVVDAPIHEDLEDIPGQNVGLNQSVTTLSGAITFKVLAGSLQIWKGVDVVYAPECVGTVAWVKNSSLISITFTSLGHRIRFGLADNSRIRSTVIIYDASDKIIDTVTTPPYVGDKVWFEYGPSSRPIKRIIFQDGGGDTFLDNFSLT